MNKISEEELVKWYRARDLFFGLNHKAYNQRKGLALAEECDHADAKWLVSTVKNLELGVWDNFEPKELSDAIKTSENTPRSRAFLIIYGGRGFHGMVDYCDNEVDPHPLAMALAAGILMKDSKSRKLAEKAAKFNEPLALFVLGQHEIRSYHKNPCGSTSKAVALFRRSAELECVDAMVQYAGWGFDFNQLGYHEWNIKAIIGGYEVSTYFQSIDYEEITDKLAIFVTGKALTIYTNIRFHTADDKSCKIGNKLLTSDQYNEAKKYIGIYLKCCDMAKNSILAWLIIAKNDLLINRDLRKLIGSYIWETRDVWIQEALNLINENWIIVK